MQIVDGMIRPKERGADSFALMLCVDCMLEMMTSMNEKVRVGKFEAFATWKAEYAGWAEQGHMERARMFLLLNNYAETIPYKFV